MASATASKTLNNTRLQLVIDIGNTRLKGGLFKQNKLVETVVLADWTVAALSEWLRSKKGIGCVLLSSVAQPDAALSAFLQERYAYRELTPATPLPFKNAYSTPETLGKDRLAGAAGAWARFPGRNSLVIDSGTCIKYDLVRSDGVYLGGNIAPGAGMRLRAMHEFTARLPLVPLHIPDADYGDSTLTALQIGGLRGAVLEMQGFINLYKKQYKNLKILLTGGDAEFFLPLLANQKCIFDPNLVLKGLHAILNYSENCR